MSAHRCPRPAVCKPLLAHGSAGLAPGFLFAPVLVHACLGAYNLHAAAQYLCTILLQGQAPWLTDLLETWVVLEGNATTICQHPFANIYLLLQPDNFKLVTGGVISAPASSWERGVTHAGAEAARRPGSLLHSQRSRQELCMLPSSQCQALRLPGSQHKRCP